MFAPFVISATAERKKEGEVLGFRWQDVDFNENCVYIR